MPFERAFPRSERRLIQVRAMHSCFTFIAAVAALTAASTAAACTPPQNSIAVPWPEAVTNTYAKSRVVFLAKVVHEKTLRAPDGEQTRRAYLKPTRFFKGNASQAPRHLDKILLNTCDQRPLAHVGSSVLVFAGTEGEWLRVTPEQDKESTSPLLPYVSAIRRVEELSSAKRR
jgi:hypothetical protein